MKAGTWISMRLWIKINFKVHFIWVMRTKLLDYNSQMTTQEYSLLDQRKTAKRAFWDITKVNMGEEPRVMTRMVTQNQYSMKLMKFLKLGLNALMIPPNLRVIGLIQKRHSVRWLEPTMKLKATLLQIKVQNRMFDLQSILRKIPLRRREALGPFKE